MNELYIYIQDYSSMKLSQYVTISSNIEVSRCQSIYGMTMYELLV